MTIYSFNILLSLFGTSVLFHVWFKLLLLDLHTDFSRGRSGGLVFPSLEEFSTVCCDPHIQRFYIVNKAEVDGFLEFSCLFDHPMDVGNLISGSSAFFKSSLNIWKFSVHVLLTPHLDNFEHYFASVWDECNCAVVWIFFGIAYLWDWEWKLTFSSPVAMVEFSKSAGILSVALSQHLLLVFEIAHPIYLLWSDRTGCYDIHFLNAEF